MNLENESERSVPRRDTQWHLSDAVGAPASAERARNE